MNRKKLPVFPCVRFHKFSHPYYAYGNTPPQDLLENVADVNEPNILLLGCGDMRSCFYTLCKNFGSELQGRFSGINFVLNDHSAEVLARNILFIYLCLQMPEGSTETRKWVATIWAIWYCHELQPEHECVLQEALFCLSEWTKTPTAWSQSENNPLNKLVKFITPVTLEKMNEVFEFWRTHGSKIDKDVVESMKKERKNTLRKEYPKPETQTSNALIKNLGPMTSFFPKEMLDAMKQDYMGYMDSNTVFAETVLDLPLGRLSTTVVNLTFYEKTDKSTIRQRLDPVANPYKCFFWASPISKVEDNVDSSSLQTCKCHPLLSTSVHQFTAWLFSSAKILKHASIKDRTSVSFTLHCSDAIDFCEQLQQNPSFYAKTIGFCPSFDLVHASNLIDYLSPPNLVLTVIPLLRCNAYLLTTTLLYRHFAPTATQYLEATFGFESHLLPILCGIRCIGHEGSYCDSVASQPRPIGSDNSGALLQCNKLLIWQRVHNGECPLKMPQLQPDSTIPQALCNSIVSSITSCFNKPHFGPDVKAFYSMNTETAVKIIQCFAVQVDAGINLAEHGYWKTLCSLLQMEESLKPFLTSLQTQFFLHGLHLHLTVLESNCPLCTGISLSQFISHFFVEFSLPLWEIPPACAFVTFVHKSSLQELLPATMNADVHAVDCMAGHETELPDGRRKLTLEFSFQDMFAVNNYRITVVGYKGGALQLWPGNKVLEGKLADFKSTKTNYSFPGIGKIQRGAVPESTFGKISKHFSDGHKATTVVVLSDAVFRTLQLEGVHKCIGTEQISKSQLQISCGSECRITVSYRHPIDYHKIILQFSRKNKSVTILASRKRQCFYEEKPMFIANPLNQLSLPHLPLSQDIYNAYCKKQFTREEQIALGQCYHKTKLIVSHLFGEKAFFQILCNGEIHGLLMIHNRVFDLQNKTPALDISFCFQEGTCGSTMLLHEWKESTSVQKLNVEMNDLDVLKKVFSYFSSRTINLKNKFDGEQLLQDDVMSSNFSRALVYLLYPDTDGFLSSVSDTSEFNLEIKFAGADINAQVEKDDMKCSNCGKQSIGVKKCSACKKAQYCNLSCQKQHWKQHKLICKFKRKSHETTAAKPISSEVHTSVSQTSTKSQAVSGTKCSICGTLSDKLTTCTVCNSEQYCGKPSQKQHMPVCNSQHIEEFNINDLPFPVARYSYNGNFRAYYGFGNTPPEDLLSSISDPHVKEPAVLILGCGDIRSCFYTLWKNFDSELQQRFSGIKFVLNDRSAAVLARNILFLYLCLQLPSDYGETKKWVAAIWAIWYSLELLPEHQCVLAKSLMNLVRWTDSIKEWVESVDNPLHDLVKFTSTTTLQQINNVLKMWYIKGNTRNLSAKQVQDCRKFQQDSNLKSDSDSIAFRWANAALGIVREDVPDKIRTAMQKEFVAYEHNGTIFAENVLQLDVLEGTNINATLFERPDGIYSLDSGTNPYECFFCSFPRAMQQEIQHLRSSTHHYLFVANEMFERYPLLATSVQQFAIWQSSSAKTLLDQKSSISFTFQCSDALQFCQQLQSNPDSFAKSIGFKPMFDLIETSNLTDTLAPPNLVLCSIPVLKSTGYLFTSTLHYKHVAETAETYLQRCFGFEAYLLPTLCAVRCIGHDGQYSSSTALRPVPWNVNHTNCFMQCRKILMWQKVLTFPLKLIKLDTNSTILSSLCNAIMSASTSFFNKPPGLGTINALCTETAIKVLQHFVAQLDKEVNTANHHYWTTLCNLLLKQKSLRPFLISLQTQTLLHGLHLHLTVSESNCPLCNEKPVSEFVGQFAVELSTGQQADRLMPSIFFMIFIHKASAIPLEELDPVSNLDADIHAIDCIAEGEVTADGQLRLIFFAPRRFLEDHYHITVLNYVLEQGKGNLPRKVMESSLNTCMVSEIDFTFKFNIDMETTTKKSSMGTVVEHYDNGDKFKSVVMLSHAASESNIMPHIDQLSASEYKITCGSHSLRICYPYPVGYDNITISREQGAITIHAPRHPHVLHREKVMNFVNPDNSLCLPSVILSKNVYSNFLRMQFVEKEHKLHPCDIGPNSPLAVVKWYFYGLFQNTKDVYFHVFSKDGHHSLLIIQNRMYDLENRTPALKLLFCFAQKSEILEQWKKIHPSGPAIMHASAHELLRNMFNHFSQNTMPSTKPTGQEQQLVKHNIHQHFIHAVVYPLYPDPDAFVAEVKCDEFNPAFLPYARDVLIDMLVEHDGSKKCSYCSTTSTNLKKCDVCGRAKYCSNDWCQMKHQEQHIPFCKRQESAAVKTCKHCGKKQSHKPLKYCPCHLVTYCSVECQRLDWPIHQVVCTAKGVKT